MSRVEILLTGEFSTMASSWSEYLCLECTEGQVVLSSRGYTALAELSQYEVESEDGETAYDIPEIIDGQVVVGQEDEYIMGGELVLHDDAAEITLEERDYEAAKAWLVEREWDKHSGFAEAWKRITAALDHLPRNEEDDEDGEGRLP
jgi:hypothetical protein